MNAMLQSFGEALDREEELPPGTVLLHGQYVVESYLVRGGFGITYLARDSLDRIVVIKECFPSAICCRVDGKVRARSEEQEGQFASVLRHFIREARRLSRLRHPDIVGVHQVFEERGTAYMALDYVSGHDLLTILEDAPERLTPALVQTLLRRTLEAVRYIHDQGILHRDISPDNILLGPTDNPTLIDFGAAREQATREKPRAFGPAYGEGRLFAAGILPLRRTAAPVQRSVFTGGRRSITSSPVRRRRTASSALPASRPAMPTRTDRWRRGSQATIRAFSPRSTGRWNCFPMPVSSLPKTG
ncbi:serine/threonine-protein kinase [Jhaorihella thermophila]